MGITNETDDVKKIEAANEKTENRGDSIRQEYGFASDVKLKECKYCRVMIPKKARVCPNCKMHLKNRWFLKAVVCLLTIAVIGMGSYCLSAYWGLTDGSLLPVWFAQSTASVPAISMSVVEPVETPASMSVVETAEENIVSQAAAGADEQIKQTSAEEETGNEPGDGEADNTLARGSGDGSKEDGEQDKPEESQVKESLEEVDVLERENADESADEDEGVRQQVEPEENQEREIPEDEVEAEFRTECKQVGYKELLRKQEDYLNEAILIEVQVNRQVFGGLFDENIYYLCKAEEKDGIERYYIIRDDREADDTLILEGDWIMVYGQLFGNCKVPAELIHTRPTVPAVSMQYLDLEE